MHASLERNLRLIRWHEILVRTNPWIAVFVLFTRGNFGIDGALKLASVYYFSVVIFEVPSGWMSDRLGRVITLRLAAVAWLGCFTLFTIGDDRFLVIAAGQVLLAVGYAFLSGTDVSFHFESLEGLDRATEYVDRQASVASIAMVAGSVATLAGGALGLIDLRLAFVASLALGCVQFAITMQFTEPTHNARSTAHIAEQVTTCLRYLRDIPLAWVFGYGVAMVVLEHVAFTLLQPWLSEMLDRPPDDLGATPLVSGITIAATALVGAAFARSSAGLGRRFGLRPALVALGAMSAVIVTTMAASTLPIVLLIIAFRGAQGAAAPILISAAIAPKVDQEHRATFLSLDSLGGRLSYSALLLAISTDVGNDKVARALRPLAGVSWVIVALTAVTAWLVWRKFGRAETA